MLERIKLYSASDWSSGYYLEKAEKRLLQNNIDIQHIDIRWAIAAKRLLGVIKDNGFDHY